MSESKQTPCAGWDDFSAALDAPPRKKDALTLAANELAAEVQRLREALTRCLEDRQCSQRCDGPHSDCPCTYCQGKAALAAAK